MPTTEPTPDFGLPAGTLRPTHGTAIRALLRLDEPLTPERRLNYARVVLANHEDWYPRPAMPERPALLALDDHELIDAYRTWELGMKLSADKRRALSYFGQWRQAVWKAEAAVAMAMLAVIDAAQVFERAECPEEADILWCFVEDQYLLRRDNVPRISGKLGEWALLRDWCVAAAVNEGAMPNYLRAMRAPTGGVPFHRPPAERRGDPAPEEDDAPIQRNFWDND